MAPKQPLPDGSSPVQASNSYAYYALVTLTSLNFLNYIDRFIFAAMIPYIQEDTKYTNEQLGYVLGAFTLVYTVLSPTFGYLGDRWHRGKLIAFGIAVWSLATAAAGFSRTYIQLLISRAAVGIGEANYATIAPGLLSDFFTKQRRGLAMSIMMAAIPLGTAAGYLIGGHFGHPESLGWRNTLFLVGFPGLVTALLTYTMREPVRGTMDHPEEAHTADQSEPKTIGWFEGYKMLVLNKGYVFASLGYCAATFALGALVSWAPKWMSSEKGLKPEDANTILGICVVAGGFVGTIIGGAIADRLAKRVKAANYWVCSVSTVASVPLMVLALVSDDKTMFIGGIFLSVTLVFFGNGPINALVMNLVPPTLRTTAMGFVVVIIHFLGDGISQPLVGYISTFIEETVKAGNPLPDFISAIGSLFAVNAGAKPLTFAFLLMPTALLFSGFFYFLGLRTPEGQRT